MGEKIAEAYDFERREVYRSSRKPGYACWIGFFKGEKGQWYISCEEVSVPDKPLPKMTRDEWYSYSYPVGYDKSEYLMEMVIVESVDGMKTWNAVSREPCRYHHSPESYAQARTSDGRFLRFVSEYARLGEDVHPGEILSISTDNGMTWQKQPPFHDGRIFSRPHRLRTLRDGTLVLAIGTFPRFDAEMPRACTYYHPDSMGIIQMHMCFSLDEGRTWSQFIPLYGGQSVSETDFVELPSGDLLFINNSIWQYPGRQLVYRMGERFIPAPFEKSATPLTVPETVCITEDGLLVGANRSPMGDSNAIYFVSDDLGKSWEPLDEVPPLKEMRYEIYQPFIHYLGGGQVACGGQTGGDLPISLKNREQFVMLHSFRIKRMRKSKKAEIKVARDFDDARQVWPNSYTISLTCGGVPLADMELEFWYAERFRAEGDFAVNGPLWAGESLPEFDNFCRYTVEERMRMGGTLIRLRTDERGIARVSLPELDRIQYVSHCIKFFVFFNRDGRCEDFRTVEDGEYLFYSLMYQDPPLK